MAYKLKALQATLTDAEKKPVWEQFFSSQKVYNDYKLFTRQHRTLVVPIKVGLKVTCLATFVINMPKFRASTFFLQIQDLYKKEGK